jgi:hypothetical protein
MEEHSVITSTGATGRTVKKPQDAQKGPDARRRPTAAREA